MNDDTTVRAAVLSAGAWSQHSHLPTLIADPAVEIIAVTSPDRRIREQISSRWPQLSVTDDTSSALAASPDLVVVSSPPATHEALVIAALESGAHVLVEKPFATEAAAAHRMADAAASLDRGLLVGFSWSSCPAIQTGQAWASEVGRVDHIEGRLVVNTRDLMTGGLDGGWGGSVATTTSTYTDPALSGGGVGMVSMSHLLSIMFWISDERPVEVACVTYPVRPGLDLHMSLLARTASGATMTIDTLSGQPGMGSPEWLLGLYGSGGDLRIDTANERTRFCPAAGEAREHHQKGAGLVDQHLPTRTAVAVARGAPVPVALSAHLGVEVVAATDAAYRAAASGRWEPVTT